MKILEEVTPQSNVRCPRVSALSFLAIQIFHFADFFASQPFGFYRDLSRNSGHFLVG